MPTPRLAKLTRPRTDGLVARPRLFADLDTACTRPFVWIAGPPGAGKTSLVSSYLDTRGRPCLWYQVDGGDADPATFFYYLGIAAEAWAGRKHKALPLFTDEYAADLEGFARRFFRTLYASVDSHVALVLDNYQEAPEAAAFHVAVRVAAEELPEGVTLCAVSRTEPPAELARARASQRLGSIGWEQLKLNAEETAAIAGSAGTDAATVAQLHEQSNGWAAGVVLMLEGIRQTGGIRPADTHENLETIFEYFAGQVFHAAPRDTQELLLRMAQLPRLTAETAQVVTGNPEAGKLLATLAKRNLFIDRRYGEQTSYQFHALFREFLKAEARERLGAAELHRVTHSAAALLQATGQIEDAFGLFVQEGAWEAAASLIKSEAPTLVEQARRETLQRWIEALPAGVTNADAWLLHWYGLTCTGDSLPRGRDLLDRALHLFGSSGDLLGEATTVIAILDNCFVHAGDLAVLDQWISTLRNLLSCKALSNERELWARLHVRYLRALVVREPLGEATTQAAARTRALLEEDVSLDVRLYGAAVLLILDPVLDGRANPPFIGRDVARLMDEQLAQNPEPSAAARFYFYMRSTQYILGTLSTPGSRETGARRWSSEAPADFGPMAIDMWRLQSQVLLYERRYAEARQMLVAHVAPGMDKIRSTWRTFVAWEFGMCELFAGNRSGVEACVRIALDAIALGSEIARVLSIPQLAGLLAAIGRTSDAQTLLDDLDRLVDLSMFPWLFGRSRLFRAYVHLKHGDRVAAVSDLRTALNNLVLVSTYRWIVFPDPDFDRLFALALEHDIETAFVTDLIRSHGIPAPDPDLDHWPWPLKLKLLGRFGIEGAPENKSGKPQHRLNDLLKAIAVRGPDGVSLQSLADEMWPDAEGDTALNSAQVSLYRLRKRLGRDDAIRVQDGIVSIDRRACWIDAWAFESKARQALGTRGALTTFEPLTRTALGLYTGHLLEVDSDAPWTLSARQRLRRLWLELVVAFGGALERADRGDESADLYERALDRDPEAEVLYRHLMLCCRTLGQTNRATEAYERCRRILGERFGTEPSPELRQIHRAITAAGAA